MVMMLMIMMLMLIMMMMVMMIMIMMVTMMGAWTATYQNEKQTFDETTHTYRKLFSNTATCENGERPLPNVGGFETARLCIAQLSCCLAVGGVCSSF